MNGVHSNGVSNGKTNGIHTSNGNGKISVKENEMSSQWGRAWSVDLFSYLGSIFILLFCPFILLFFHITCAHHQCSLTQSFLSFYQHPSMTSLISVLPSLSMDTMFLYTTWIFCQAILALLPDVIHRLVPRYTGGVRYGAITPAGNLNEYNINGLQAWIITHAVWFLNAFYFNIFSPSIISRSMGSLVVLFNIFGYLLSVCCFIKGHYFPTNKDDCKFSGSIIYDFLMGIEFNPRIGKHFDFKLFFNGRPGIIFWTLINLSYAWHQYENYGFVTDSMILVNLLQGLYVLDFFWNEAWYLKTIDICHDHFGWYLAWGDLAWLPTMYTLQGLYLVSHPVHLGIGKASVILALGMAGYYLFRSANCQKDRFRANPEKCEIWGKPASYIKCMYASADGRQHNSTLLTSGWWGVARHMNYTGDLMGSLAYCLCCGSEHILPYFYIVFMLMLLVHRIYRDEHRCMSKYGKSWKQYTTVVPYRLVPGLY